jgi:hypothetical protein
MIGIYILAALLAGCGGSGDAAAELDTVMRSLDVDGVGGSDSASGDSAPGDSAAGDSAAGSGEAVDHDSGEPEPAESTCTDYLDNDGDGWIDGEDPACSITSEAEEDDGYDGGYACNDGEDNDGDGDIDGEDADCVGATGAEQAQDNGRDTGAG